MPDIREILPAGAYAELASGYDDATFRVANQGAVQGTYPPAQVLTDPVLDAFYAPPEGQPLLDPKDREIAILAVLAASGGSARNIAIHVYVGIAVGLTVEQIAGVIGAVGAYAGAGRLMDGLAIAETTLSVLAAQVEAGKAGIMDVVPALKVKFP